MTTEFSGQKAGEGRLLAPGMNFRWCPAGMFTMGSPASEMGREKDENQVQVTLSSGFWMGETEVTQGQWETVMQTKPWQGERKVIEGANYAASYISHGDGGYDTLEANSACEFCRRLTDAEQAAGRLPANWKYTLPTEAQWEYAWRVVKAD